MSESCSKWNSSLRLVSLTSYKHDDDDVNEKSVLQWIAAAATAIGAAAGAAVEIDIRDDGGAGHDNDSGSSSRRHGRRCLVKWLMVRCFSPASIVSYIQ